MEGRKKLPVVESQGCCEPFCGPTACGSPEPGKEERSKTVS